MMYSQSMTMTPNKGAMDTRCAAYGGPVVYVYLGFVVAFALVKETYNDLGLSSFLTLSVGVQLFALCCLRCRVAEFGGVQGLSQKSLIMQCFVYGLRLCSSSWLRGYVPVDGTGDGLYQSLDLVALLMALHLVYCFHSRQYAHTYQAELDTVDAKLMIVVCITLAVLVHPDLNDRPLFDTTWTAALYIDSVAMFPQLWMMGRAGIGAETAATMGPSSHYLVGVAASRAANFVFWYYGYPELAPEDTTKMNLPGYAVIGAHVIQFLLLADFLYYFVRHSCVTLAGKAGCCKETTSGGNIMVEL